MPLSSSSLLKYFSLAGLNFQALQSQKPAKLTTYNEGLSFQSDAGYASGEYWEPTRQRSAFYPNRCRSSS